MPEKDAPEQASCLAALIRGSMESGWAMRLRGHGWVGSEEKLPGLGDGSLSTCGETSTGCKRPAT